jgi:GntR family transcriptional regulator/MocR family aminotransferase
MRAGNMLTRSKSKGAVRADQNKGKRGTPTLLVALDRESRIPIFRQIYNATRQAILSGALASGSRLPPTRALAQELGVSRMTVVLAYEDLEAEGYIQGSGSAGTFVADLELPRETRNIGSTGPAAGVARSAGFSIRGAPIPFRIGEPALDAFPMALWTRLYARCARRAGISLLGYGDPEGYLPLRQAIAGYVGVSRSVRATVDQVILVRGARQAMDLVTRVLLQPGDQVWVEDPGYLAARTLLALAGAIPVPVPVDKDGLIVEAGVREAPAAVMACVVPSHHFPLGRTLSLARRLALLEWARRAAAWIIEDDFDSEFRYTGSPIASLQGLDSSGRVIYIGTFSKTIYPALRLGYLIAPPELADRFRLAETVIDQVSPTVEQAVLTEFIEEGHFTRHVRRMRGLYRERQQALLAAASNDLPDLLRVDAADSGMQVVGWLLRDGLDDKAVSRETRKHGIETEPLSQYCMRAPLPPALLLGFAALKPKELLSGVRALRRVLASLK